MGEVSCLHFGLAVPTTVGNETTALSRRFSTQMDPSRSFTLCGSHTRPPFPLESDYLRPPATYLASTADILYLQPTYLRRKAKLKPAASTAASTAAVIAVTVSHSHASA